MTHRFIVALCSVALLAGCTHGANKPEITPVSQAVEQHLTPWWQAFDDPLLNSFASQLLKQNLDIKIAEARLEAARAARQSVQAGLWPQIDIKADGNRGNNKTASPTTQGSAGFDAAWDADVFGRIRANISAADARILSEEAARADIQHVIMADLARAVISWRQARLTTTEIKSLLKAQDDQVSLLQSRNDAGLVDQSVLERAKAQRAQTATTLPQAAAAAAEAQFTIARLLADRDDMVEKMLEAAPTRNMVVPSVDDLNIIDVARIRLRPDIQQARAALLEAQANLRAAEANVWPKITLGAFLGIQDGSGALQLAANPLWSIAGGLSAPILNFGRIRSEIDNADAKARAAALQYEDVVNRALAETKTAYVDTVQGLQQVKQQELALHARQDTVRIAKERFERGLTDMTDLTTAQSELDEATVALINLKTTAAIAYIRLQKALSAVDAPEGDR